MKNNRRKVRIERRNAKTVAVASEQLALYRQAAAFHKAYLEIELGAEEAYLNALQARIDALKSTPETVIVTEEEPEGDFVIRDKVEKPVEEW